MTTYNTNLAAEFYVLSMLYRLGVDASLTLGNRKAVDIIVFKENRAPITIDVNGLAKPYDWPAGGCTIECVNGNPYGKLKLTREPIHDSIHHYSFFMVSYIF